MSDEVKTEAVEPIVTKTYFGSREVKEWGEVPEAGKVWVHYVDGGREAMTNEEWSCRSNEPVNEDRNWDCARLQGIQKEILASVIKANVRLEDLSTLFTLVRDGIQLALNQAKEVAFEQPAWTVRIDDVQKVLDDGKMNGKTAKFTGMIRKVQGSAIDY